MPPKKKQTTNSKKTKKEAEVEALEQEDPIQLTESQDFDRKGFKSHFVWRKTIQAKGFALNILRIRNPNSFIYI